MVYFVALLIFILVYVVSKFLLSKIESVAPIAEILGLIIGIFAALVFIGAIHI